MKKLMLITAPVTSRSGYGAHARDLVLSLMDMDKFEIKIMDVRWGDCPRNALSTDNSKDMKIQNCIMKQPKLDRQPDVYIDIRIPNEFETFGKVNIGITAGVETDIVSGKFLEDCNKMDLVIVPSEHSKQGFINSIYDKVQQTPDGKQQKVGEMRLENPDNMKVLFEGADEDIYKPLSKDEIGSEFFDWLNDEVPEKFAFLSVGQWTSGGYGEDRKDLGKTIKVFYESFANKKKQPALILKTSGASYSIIDKEDILRKIRSVKKMFPVDWKLPPVYLLHGDLSNEEMNKLYNHPKVKAFVSLTHGEGFGRPLLEASMVGLPIITTNWSGHLDFLSDKYSILINGQLGKVPKSMVWKDIIVEESKWLNVNELEAGKAFTHAFNNHSEIKSNAKKLMNENRNKFTLNKMTEKFEEILEPITSSEVVNLKLPKLTKVKKNTKSSEKGPIKLPKLKKVTAAEAV
tara:strand:- start:146 stop:1525 length:1380 start_codon:yes stop_codon:yes gene_type:complete